MLPNDRDEPAEIDIDRVITVTDRAILILVDEEKIWIPLSMIDTESEVPEKGESGQIVIPEWLAKEKGLV